MAREIDLPSMIVAVISLQLNPLVEEIGEFAFGLDASWLSRSFALPRGLLFVFERQCLAGPSTKQRFKIPFTVGRLFIGTCAVDWSKHLVNHRIVW